MTLNELKMSLSQVSELNFKLNNGKEVPKHFHITEVGQIDKKFIDCGGTVRNEQKVSLQLWESVDVWHRLEPKKLLHIIELSEEKVGVGNHEIEVEYQADTIGKFGLDYNGKEFILTTQSTACLASDKCGIPSFNVKETLVDLSEKVSGCCTPGAGCC